MTQTPLNGPARTRNWLAALSVALSATVVCTTEFLPVGLLRYISQGLAVTDTVIGLSGNFIGGSSAQRNVKTTLFPSILFIALPLFMLPVLGTSRPWVLVAMAAWGTVCGALPVALQMWMAQVTREIHEGGMALFTANFQISIALGSFFGGRIVHGFGIFNARFFGAGLPFLSILTLTLMGGHVRRIEEPATF